MTSIHNIFLIARLTVLFGANVVILIGLKSVKLQVELPIHFHSRSFDLLKTNQGNHYPLFTMKVLE